MTPPTPSRVTLCRDCCCGTPKLPGVDHEAQTTRLQSLVPTRISTCLDACDQANVVVVHPSSTARATGARPIWLGLVNDPEATEDIATWVLSGGPGTTPMPPILDLYVFTPPPRRPTP